MSAANSDSNHRPDPPPAPEEPREEAAPQDFAQASAPGDGEGNQANPQQSQPVSEEDDILQRLNADLVEAEKRALRAQAELENYRKRVHRDMEQQQRYAALPLMYDLLGVVDNLGRAVEAAEQNESSSGLLEGVRMVASQLLTILEKNHCKPIQAEGADFDPHFHEALAQMPSEEVPPGKVAQVVQSGYQLHDRVVRPAQVIVSAGPPENK